MPTGQQSYSGSVQVVNAVTASYTATVQPMRTKEYTASVYPVIRPDRYVRGSVEARTVPSAATDIDYHSSVYAYFTPITPERFVTASVYAAPPVTYGQYFTASVTPLNVATIAQTFMASVKITDAVNKAFTASVVKSVLNNDRLNTASVVVATPVAKLYTASVVCKVLDLVRAYTASARPYVAISPAEQIIRNTDINLLVTLVQQRDALTASIAQQTSQLAFAEGEIVRLVDILAEMDNIPSCRLSSVSPSVNIPRTGGTVMFVNGFEFIPTCTVDLFQGATVIGTYTPVVTASTTMSFVLPNFTLVGGLNLSNPISIQVNNPDGQSSEVITFTLAAS